MCPSCSCCPCRLCRKQCKLYAAVLIRFSSFLGKRLMTFLSGSHCKCHSNCLGRNTYFRSPALLVCNCNEIRQFRRYLLLLFCRACSGTPSCTPLFQEKEKWFFLFIYVYKKRYRRLINFSVRAIKDAMTVPLFKIKIDETVRSSFCVYTVSFVDCVNETFWVLPTLRVFPSECLSIIYLVFFFFLVMIPTL